MVGRKKIPFPDELKQKETELQKVDYKHGYPSPEHANGESLGWEASPRLRKKHSLCRDPEGME